MKKLTLGGLALAVSLGSLAPSPGSAEPAAARAPEPGAPKACGAGGCGGGKCGAGKCGGKPAPPPPEATPGTDSKCGAGRCAPGRCGAAPTASSAPAHRQPGPPLGPDEPSALLGKGKSSLEAARTALAGEDKAATLAALDGLVEVAKALTRFDPAAVKVPEALLFGRLEALKLNTLGSRSLAEGSHWRAARGSLKQLGQVFEGLYEPLGVERTATATGSVAPPAGR